MLEVIIGIPFKLNAESFFKDLHIVQGSNDAKEFENMVDNI